MEYSNNLSYQTEVINNIIDVFNVDGLFKNNKMLGTNPTLNLNENNISKLKEKIYYYNRKIENSALHKNAEIKDYLNLDIKMETGTGKTYVYVKTIFELNKNYNIHKFIILVPSVAIKLGTKKFIEDSSCVHFHQEYGKYISLIVQENSSAKDAETNYNDTLKKFVESAITDDSTISVLLINKDYLNEDRYGKKMQKLFKDFYSTPAEAIESVKPFLIVDEPHRFRDDNKSMKFMMDKIMPQCVIRFGATFPEEEEGKGKNKKIYKDYKNLIFDLDSKKAFSENIVKGINVYIEGERENDYNSFEFTSFKKGEKVTVKYKKIGDKRDEKKEVRKGQLLNFLGEEFKGIKINDISDNEIILSDGTHINKKANTKDSDEEIKFTNYDFSKETQESMIRQGINKHFEREKENFYRKDKIKTICLFFIDDISSYRDRETGKEQWVKKLFESILEEKVKKEIELIDDKNDKSIYDIEYKKYLEKTLENLRINEGYDRVHAGYFADDKDKKEGSEYSQILIEKEKTLSIYNEDNSFNTFRFIFSKWTLKEGWDNPNVFTIVKLRGSGSENSKIQEVGRGLRLPVDTNMKRVTNEQFYLSYIVNNNERDFALTLINEVATDKLYEENGILYISTNQINNIAIKLDKTFEEIFTTMIIEKMINPKSKNDHYEIIDIVLFTEKYGSYYDKDSTIDGGALSKITLGEPKANGKTKINKENFNKIKELWEILNKNFIITYGNDAFNDNNMEKLIIEVLKEKESEIFKSEVNEFKRVDVSDLIERNKKDITNEDVSSEFINTDIYEKMVYSEFLKVFSKETNIPIINIDTALKKYLKDIDENKDINRIFRKSSMLRIVDSIKEKKHNLINGKFSYEYVGERKETFLTDENGKIREEVNSSYLGTKVFRGSAKISDKYLYKDITYDSDIELNNIKTDDERIEVFGKIPRNSVRIPKIDGKTCSPDFMYVIKDNKGKTKKMNLVVESKDYQSYEGMRGSEILTKEYMNKYFECLKAQVKDENISIRFDYQLKTDDMIDIIKKMINE